MNPVQKPPMCSLSVPKIAMNATAARSLVQPQDFLVLYRTLVKDGALPMVYDREFMSLEPIVMTAARRENDKAITITNVTAALWLDKFGKKKTELQRHTKTIEEQFILGCAKEPRRFQSRLQKILHTDASARSDAEELERQRWVLTLGELLRHTSTPMGNFIQQDSERLKLLGSGQRASTLRARVRSIRKYIQWLTISKGIVCPKQVEHCCSYLETKASKPCTRRALKEAHRAMSFLEQAAGVEETNRVTCTAIYKTIFEQLLVGRPLRQAPRMYVSMLKSSELMLVDSNVLPFIRVYSWWVFLPNWNPSLQRPSRTTTWRHEDQGQYSRCLALPFQNHRRRQEREQQTSTHRTLLLSCVPHWVSVGLALLQSMAPFQRDYFRLARKTTCSVFRRRSDTTRHTHFKIVSSRWREMERTSCSILPSRIIGPRIREDVFCRAQQRH